MADIPEEEFILKTTSACAGCSASLILRYVTKAAGKDTVLVVPACCTSVIQGKYPDTAVNIPVYNVAFASAAAVASGMSEAFRAVGKKTNVICFAGDGGTVDIGIQALSGALERGTDFLYVCYDNEAYSNTGMQRSGATPIGARTTTTPLGKTEYKKDLDAIVQAHNPVYMATACSAYPVDLYNKVKKALSIPGPKFMHVLTPCPPGWRYPSEKTIEVGKLAVKSGMWVLYEREYGKLSVTGASKTAMKKRIPVTAYLGMQGRFKTASDNDIKILQEHVDMNMKRLEQEEKGVC
ncbi:pyruvate ferredoxin oxidoreductase beta subunit [Methanomicrobium sp. W14]|uniref:thiamine pyrophosphate-dependent enzyme n=1 Tax=Methanomicrobium sp. W14 TaxID=2817839 RepID=UPI001AE988AE|nr:thiamine pyrophosphate-dependent enzyme [Methanomicrobium sp. W14]MBP2133788.1 pyruvate ferredoxin oxidoreductase beta subunit [Methanomicrobium sp. W14]